MQSVSASLLALAIPTRRNVSFKDTSFGINAELEESQHGELQCEKLVLFSKVVSFISWTFTMCVSGVSSVALRHVRTACIVAPSMGH